MKMQWVWISLAWVGIIVAIIAGLFFFTDLFQKNPIPKNIRESVDFPTYYPSDLPEGYSIRPNSYEVSDNVLLYTLDTPDGKKITVSQQKPPESFDFENFQNNTLKNKRSSELSNQNIAYVGQIESANIASLRTATTWIFLSSNKQQVSLQTLEILIKTFDLS